MAESRFARLTMNTHGGYLDIFIMWIVVRCWCGFSTIRICNKKNVNAANRNKMSKNQLIGDQDEKGLECGRLYVECA
jgi:hypothetical protein